MNRNLVETLLGAAVLGVAIVFFVFAYSTAGVQSVSGYELTARFDSVSGIKRGSDVRISGIKVGSVIDQKLDPQTFFAVVRLSVETGIKLPRDSSAKISSEGLLGETFLALTPGGDEASLKPGEQIQFTQGAIDLISLVGQAVFGKTDAGEDKGQDKGAAQPGGK